MVSLCEGNIGSFNFLDFVYLVYYFYSIIDMHSLYHEGETRYSMKGGVPLGRAGPMTADVGGRMELHRQHRFGYSAHLSAKELRSRDRALVTRREPGWAPSLETRSGPRSREAIGPKGGDGASEISLRTMCHWTLSLTG